MPDKVRQLGSVGPGFGLKRSADWLTSLPNFLYIRSFNPRELSLSSAVDGQDGQAVQEGRRGNYFLPPPLTFLDFFY